MLVQTGIRDVLTAIVVLERERHRRSPVVPWVDSLAEPSANEASPAPGDADDVPEIADPDRLDHESGQAPAGDARIGARGHDGISVLQAMAVVLACVVATAAILVLLAPD